MHHRFTPRAHRFDYRIFMFALDLDELDGLHRGLRLFSVNRRNLYSFREGDFLPADDRPAYPKTPATTLKARVVAHLAERGIDLTGGRVMLVTLPRVAGYLFNPVSFYFCQDRHGQPVAALAEVTNTFREMKPFLLGPDTRQGGAFHLRTPKYFYVSPFTDVDVAFDFTLRDPGSAGADDPSHVKDPGSAGADDPGSAGADDPSHVKDPGAGGSGRLFDLDDLDMKDLPRAPRGPRADRPWAEALAAFGWSRR